MITLRELTILSSPSGQEKRREIEKENKSKEEFLKITLDLEERLKEAAVRGEKMLIVCFFEANPENLSYEILRLFDKDYGIENALQKKWITYYDIENGTQGTFSRVYYHCKELGLVPKINLTSDAHKMGFDIIIEW